MNLLGFWCDVVDFVQRTRLSLSLTRKSTMVKVSIDRSQYCMYIIIIVTRFYPKTYNNCLAMNVIHLRNNEWDFRKWFYLSFIEFPCVCAVVQTNSSFIFHFQLLFSFCIHELSLSFIVRDDFAKWKKWLRPHERQRQRHQHNQFSFSISLVRSPRRIYRDIFYVIINIVCRRRIFTVIFSDTLLATKTTLVRTSSYTTPHALAIRNTQHLSI